MVPGNYPTVCSMKDGLIQAGKLMMGYICWGELLVLPPLNWWSKWELLSPLIWNIQQGKIFWYWVLKGSFNGICVRNACGIRLSDNEYVVTGGFYTSKIVSKYSKNGWQKDLPKLNDGRRGHGCSAYTRNNEMVII